MPSFGKQNILMENLKKIELYDTTLRDGAGAQGISFSLEDKKEIFKILDKYGIDLIEGGYPSANPKDEEFFKNEHSPKIVAFCSTHKINCNAAEDEDLQKTLNTANKIVCIYGKTSKIHVDKILKIAPDVNLKIIFDSVKFFSSKKIRVIFDCEHFFDGFKFDKTYALSTIAAAVDGGADTITLCDSNGGSFPWEIEEITKVVTNKFPNIKIGIHCHDDMGLATADTLAAIRAGARHVQGTFLGFGERAGNTNLSTLIASLKLKTDYLVEVNLKDTTKIGQKIAEISNISIDESMPYIGKNAFSHKAGTHVDAMFKGLPYEHIDPNLVGNTTNILLSEFSGKSLINEKLKALFPQYDENKIMANDVLTKVKNLELEGYQFEGADASFYLLAKKLQGQYNASFEVLDYKFESQKQEGKNVGSSKATVTIKANGKEITVEKKGNGPVNALDQALRFGLCSHFPQLKDVKLIDYKVRVIDSKSATGATVRVLITSKDDQSTWTTVGVSTDILEASLDALCDSFEYKLKS